MARLDQVNIPTLLLVLLLVFSIALVASTIDSVALVDTGDGDANQPRVGSTSSGDIQFNVTGEGSGGVSEDTQYISLVYCISFLRHPFAIFGIVAALLLFVYGLVRRYNVATAGLLSTAILPMSMGTYFFLTNCPGGDGSGSGGLLSGSSVMGAQGGISSAPQIPPTAGAVVFGAIMLAAVLMVVVMTGDEENFEPIEEEDPEVEMAAFARAAGRAADRIEEANVPVDNSVYRAWLEMTGLLDIDNPEATAPRDFAAAAIEVGLDEDDVSELTQLFNEVRYGGKDAGDREERAIEILRDIEQTYQDAHDQMEEEDL